MKERTLRILAALIKDFVEAATPVASKELLESGEFPISSATVRNEFALLEEIGLIESPHVSSGKIPTEKGYRFFVDQLLKEDAEEERLIQSIFKKHIAEYHLEKTRESLFDIIKLVSHLSGNVAFTSIENDQTLYLGLSKVLMSPEFLSQPERGAQIVEVFERREKFQDMLIIKMFLYTGIRVSELINIKLSDVDLGAFQIKIVQGKGKKDRVVPFSQAFRETLAMHIANMKSDNAKYLFESNRKKKYTDRAIRQILRKYSDKASLTQSLFPHALRHFLFTWLKKQSIDDALIQPCSGHDSRKSLEIYSKLSITEAQCGYDEVMKKFPV